MRVFNSCIAPFIPGNSGKVSTATLSYVSLSRLTARSSIMLEILNDNQLRTHLAIFRKKVEVAAQVSQPGPFGGYKLARAAETGKAGRFCGRWNFQRFYGAAPASETDSTVRPGPFQGFSPTP